MPGSACSAWKARAGLQAPRITWGSSSASSFFFIVAWTSISVSTPNPWSASAARVRCTASSNGSRVVMVEP